MVFGSRSRQVAACVRAASLSRSRISNVHRTASSFAASGGGSNNNNSNSSNKMSSIMGSQEGVGGLRAPGKRRNFAHRVRGSLTSKGPIIALYRSILRAHTWLPENQRDIGDAFVKHEFRQHKDASPEFVVGFITQWQEYLEKLTEQIARMPEKNESGGSIGADIPQDVLEEMSDDQRQQLRNLEFETRSLRQKK